jgi:hypothetical protein
MPMAVASAGRERRTDATPGPHRSVCLGLPSLPNERRIHDQEADVSDLLEVWPGIRLFRSAGALLNRAAGQPQSFHVSYLAQT